MVLSSLVPFAFGWILCGTWLNATTLDELMAMIFHCLAGKVDPNTYMQLYSNSSTKTTQLPQPWTPLPLIMHTPEGYPRAACITRGMTKLRVSDQGDPKHSQKVHLRAISICPKKPQCVVLTRSSINTPLHICHWHTKVHRKCSTKRQAETSTASFIHTPQWQHPNNMELHSTRLLYMGHWGLYQVTRTSPCWVAYMLASRPPWQTLSRLFLLQVSSKTLAVLDFSSYKSKATHDNCHKTPDVSMLGDFARNCYSKHVPEYTSILNPQHDAWPTTSSPVPVEAVPHWGLYAFA
jgi:hypothetical protein